MVESASIAGIDQSHVNGGADPATVSFVQRRTSAPSTVGAGITWYDQDTNTLRVYETAYSKWMHIGPGLATGTFDEVPIDSSSPSST